MQRHVAQCSPFIRLIRHLMVYLLWVVGRPISAKCYKGRTDLLLTADIVTALTARICEGEDPSDIRGRAHKVARYYGFFYLHLPTENKFV